MSLRRPPIPVVFRLLAGLLLLSQGGCMSALTTAAMREALRETVDSVAAVAASDAGGSDRDADASTGVAADDPADESAPVISEPKPPSLDESVNQAVARLRNIGELDAQTQATLLSILENTSPEDWPAAIDAFAASLEAYRPPPPAVAPPAVAPPVVQTPVVQPAAGVADSEPAAAPLVFPAIPPTAEPSRLAVIETARSVAPGPDEFVEDEQVFAAGMTRQPAVALEPMTFPEPPESQPEGQPEGLPEIQPESFPESREPQVVAAPPKPFEPPVTLESPVVMEQPVEIPPAKPAPPAFAVLNASFVSRVRAWGVVEKFPEAVFRPGQDVIVYFELDSLTTRQSPSGHSTSVDTIFRLFDSEGRQVGQWDFEPIDETCLTPRRDYFARYFVRIPETAAPGPHRLELMISDLVAGVSSRTNLDLEVRP